MISSDLSFQEKFSRFRSFLQSSKSVFLVVWLASRVSILAFNISMSVLDTTGSNSAFKAFSVTKRPCGHSGSTKALKTRFSGSVGVSRHCKGL